MGRVAGAAPGAHLLRSVWSRRAADNDCTTGAAVHRRAAGLRCVQSLPGSHLQHEERMMKGHTFRFKGNRLHFPGVTFGYGDSNPYLIDREGNWVVVRKPASQEWAELGRTAVYPAEWWLLRVEPVVKHDGLFQVVEVVAKREPGRFWRRCRFELVEAMYEAARLGYSPQWVKKETP